MSGCVYEPVLVGINDKKLEQEEQTHSSQLGVGVYALWLRVLTCRGELHFHLEKSFYPRNDQEITVIDADGNTLLLPLLDLQFLAFVNTSSQIDYNFIYSSFKD